MSEDQYRRAMSAIEAALGGDGMDFAQKAEQRVPSLNYRVADERVPVAVGPGKPLPIPHYTGAGMSMPAFGGTIYGQGSYAPMDLEHALRSAKHMKQYGVGYRKEFQFGGLPRGKFSDRVVTGYVPPPADLITTPSEGEYWPDPSPWPKRAIEIAREVQQPRENVAASPAAPALSPASAPRELTIPASRPAPVVATGPRGESLWEIYNRTELPADFVRASEAMLRGERADGGETTASRRRKTIAEQMPLERPQADGEGFQRMRAYLRAYPYRPGEATAQAYNPSIRDVIGGAIAGDNNTGYGSTLRRRAADALVGSTGLEGSGTVGFGALDAIPRVGAALQIGDVGKAMADKDYATAAVMSALPAAIAGRRQIVDAGRRAMEIAREYAPQAGAAGVVGATMMPQEAEAVVPSKIAAKLGFKPTVGQSEIGRRMAEGTPGASIVDDALRLVLSRNQMTDQAGDLSVRGGVFYLPQGSPAASYYRKGGGSGFFYGGGQPISGETTIYNPLIVKGATGGKAPEAAYRQLLGKDAFDEMQKDVFHSSRGVPPPSLVNKFLEKYASPLADQYQHIIYNSRFGNQLRYALQEAAAGQAARDAGHDAIIGYSTRRDKTPFVSEVFDLRENRYPTPEGGYSLWPELEEKVGRADGGEVEKDYANRIGDLFSKKPSEPYREMHLPDLHSDNIERRDLTRRRWNQLAIEALKDRYGSLMPRAFTPAMHMKADKEMSEKFSSVGETPVDPLSFDKMLTTTNQYPARGTYAHAPGELLDPHEASDYLRAREAIFSSTPRADPSPTTPSQIDDLEYRFAGGGSVRKALQAVRDLFDTPEMTKWRGNSVIPSASMEDRYFHGTSKDKDFDRFNVGRHGVWLTKDPAEASQYALENDSMGYRLAPSGGWNMEKTNTASRVMPVFARAENPYIGPLPDFAQAENYKRAQSQWFDQLRAQGHDAWLPEGQPDLAVILRDPEQIKSAISNTGEFSGPRMDRAEGGEVTDDPGIVERAMSFLSQFNPIGSAEAAPMGKAVQRVVAPLVTKPRADINVMPQLAERYPIIAPPVRAIDARTGKEFMQKSLSEEAQEAQTMRKLIQGDIEAGRYEPYFPVERRFDVDPSFYPEHQSTLSIVKKKPETQQKYETHARSPEATQRLDTAFERGMRQADLAGNWYYMGQLEKEYINEYGPTVGRALFKTRFPDAMAATTGGADPSSNLLMAHLGNFLHREGRPMPTAAHEFPFPVGGRYVTGNMDQYRKMIMENAGVTPANPKRYNFSEDFLGRKGPTIDEQMSGLFDPGMAMPPAGTYGHYQGAMEDLARRQGVDPRFYQEVAWAGAKDAKTKGGYRATPMIETVNQAIERTSRLTGLPPDDVVRRGLVRAEMPLYASGGAVADNAIDIAKQISQKSAKVKKAA